MAVSALNDLERNKIDKYLNEQHASVLTIMFTDIQDFTELTELRGDGYSAKLRRIHDSLVDNIIENEFGGVVVKHCGDSVMAIFSEVHKATLAALKIQSALRELNTSKPEGIVDDLKVRIGLHVGEVGTEYFQGQRDVFGRHVNRASRVEAMAEGGQIYVSQEVYDNAKDKVSHIEGRPIIWSHHGKYRTKGITDGIDIYEISELSESQTHRAPKIA